MPIIIEKAIKDKANHCDLVLYQISPTTAIPATYPLIDPDIEYHLMSKI